MLFKDYFAIIPIWSFNIIYMYWNCHMIHVNIIATKTTFNKNIVFSRSLPYQSTTITSLVCIVLSLPLRMWVSLPKRDIVPSRALPTQHTLHCTAHLLLVSTLPTKKQRNRPSVSRDPRTGIVATYKQTKSTIQEEQHFLEFSTSTINK